jgi:anti-sigma regulatory factor (Ser/Thr protein kinase)
LQGAVVSTINAAMNGVDDEREPFVTRACLVQGNQELDRNNAIGGYVRRLRDRWMPPAMTGESSVTWRLADNPAELAHARELVRKTLATWMLSDHAELAELAVTELATNALRHGTSPIDIRLSLHGNTLSIEVHDHGASRPVPRQATADDEQGRGLALLDGLIKPNSGAHRVADDADGPGKTVYVLLSLDPGQADPD